MGITVSEINIYPVKGLGGISLDACEMTTRGFKNDRRFMIVDREDEFVSQREMPKMATIWMDMLDMVDGELEFATADCDPIRVPATPAPRPTRTVRVWSSHVEAQAVSAEADAWLSDYLGADLRLVYMPETSMRQCNATYAKNSEIVSFADGFPVLITNEASLADLNARIAANGGGSGGKVPMNRFRANIVIKGASAWEEDQWGELAIGDAVFRNVKPCGRCQVTTTDQATGEVRGSEPLRTLSGFRDSAHGVLFGVNLVPVTLGRVGVGDILVKK